MIDVLEYLSDLLPLVHAYPPGLRDDDDDDDDDDDVSIVRLLTRFTRVRVLTRFLSRV